MRRFIVTSLLTFLSFCLAGCESSPSNYMREHGKPSLIGEQSGDQQRYYRPGKKVAEWHDSIMTLYYLGESRKVVFNAGGKEVRPITSEEDAFLRQVLQEQTASQDESTDEST